MEKEIAGLKAEIGEKAYTMLKSGAVDTGELMQYVNQIEERNAKIAEQNGRILEIERTNQEILGQSEAAPGTVLCPACGEKMAAGTRFCTKCGSKLQ